MARLVYLDWAATAPLCEESACALAPYLASGTETLCFGNANSLHSVGRKAFIDLENAREKCAYLLGAARPDEIIFTSGATEANNAALLGITRAYVAQQKQQGKHDFVPHIVISAIEHDSVLSVAKSLKASGIEVTLLKPDRNGFIHPDEFRNVLCENTLLASIQLANNEIGTIQDIKNLTSIAHERNVFFHTDAVQALGKIAINVRELGIDAASFSGHKVSGPKGVGILYLKANTPFSPLIVGGGQEQDRRSGTQNVSGVVGMIAACEAACDNQVEENERLTQLRDSLYRQLCANERVFPSVLVEKESSKFLPNIVNICVEGFESETLVLRLDQAGFAVSGGSACSSSSLEPSHVLQAIGIARDLSLGSLRVSLGRLTTEEEIENFLEAFKKCVEG